MRTGSKTAKFVAAATAVYVGAFAMVAVRAQTVPRPFVPRTSLQGLAVPTPPNIGHYIQDNTAAIALGKALFWDMQASSDNVLACASCHFHAGADDRVKNQINPDLNNMAGAPTCGNVAPFTAANPPPAPNCVTKIFDPVATGNKGGPNYSLRVGDFPFHQLADVNDRESIVLKDSNDVVSSAGVYSTIFGAQLSIFEKNRLAPDGVFMVGNVETRRVEPRNTPTVINAALNYRNFWDGRANSVFNGVTPFGPHDLAARVWVDDVCPIPNSTLTKQCAVQAIVRIPFSSAASQAVGPALSGFEMSAAGRTFADLGRKMLSTRPLLYQQVSATDSVLGTYRNAIGFGLNTNYTALIKKAFWPEYWGVPDAVYKASSGDTHTQMEANFSLFWGLAIQAYEQTLISDQTPFDSYSAGNLAALGDQAKRGLAIFSGDRGRCVNCHKGPELTGASTRMVLGSGLDTFAGDGPIENMKMGGPEQLGNAQLGFYDNGFYNIGVVPAGNDVGVGGTDPWGVPLSFTRQLKNQMNHLPAPDAMTHSLVPCTFQALDGCTQIFDPNFRDAVDGSFKAPGLRNVELTGPYFHNGGYSTLEQVIDFYSRGGNVRATQGGGNTSGYSSNPSNLDNEIFVNGFTPAEKADLVAFLKALTDDRVRYERAPFDHPGLLVPNGAVGDNVSVTSIGGRSIDQFRSIPAVGAAGLSSPILPFKPKP